MSSLSQQTPSGDRDARDVLDRSWTDEIDIGFDEYQMLIVAGSWTNDSIVHNDNTYPAAVLQPSALSSGFSQRHLILHERYAGYPLTVHGVLNPTASNGPGWVQPPGALSSPAIDPTAGFEHRRRYISYTGDPVPPPATNPTMPWSFASPQAGPFIPPYTGMLPSQWNQTYRVIDLLLSDAECSAGACAHEYFNLQCVSEGYPTAGTRHHSNLQNDYR